MKTKILLKSWKPESLTLHGISDHSLAYICRKISIPKEPQKIVFSRQFKNYISYQFKEELRHYTIYS